MAEDGGERELEFPDHYRVMLEKLNEQRRLDQFTDITLIVDGHQFRAHKAVLAACSQFFHKFFQDFTQEPLVEIEGVSNSAFRHLMEFTYTATLALRGQEEVVDVWRAAEYLQMQEAIKALNNRVRTEGRSDTPQRDSRSVSENNKAKKRKIAETSNVITETLPSAEAESEHVEIEVEVGEDGVVQECVTEEEVLDGGRETDDSALALLADITSKYRQGAPNAKEAEEEVQEEARDLQEEAALATRTLEGIEVVEVQISDNMFRCDKCERCFKLFYHLKQHMKTHAASGDKPHLCKHCGKTYAREGALKQHLNTCHYDAEELNRKLKKKVHMCVYCSKEFDHFGHFKEHLRKHTGEKPFECPDCHERFARNSTLKCHMTACQNGAGAKKGRKKLYECQVCNEVFNSWEQFKDHLVIHTGDKPNHCTLCDQWFTHARDLTTHLQQQHQEDGVMVELQDGVMKEQVELQGAVIEGRVELQDGVRVEERVELQDEVMVEERVELQDGVMVEERVELQDEVMVEERVELQDGVMVEERVELQDEVMVEERVELQDGVMVEERVELQDGVMVEERVELQDGVMVEERVELQDEVMVEERVELQDGVMVEERVELQDGVRVEERVELQDRVMVEERVELQGGVMVEERVELQDGVMVEERVELQDGVMVEERVELQDGVMVEERVALQDGVMVEERVALQDGVMVEERVELQDGVMVEERVELQDGVMVEERVELQDGVMVEERVELQDGVMVEERVELQDGVMEQQLILQDEVVMVGRVELQDGVMMEEGVELQDAVMVENRVETVLIEVQEEGVKGHAGDV